ncbi:(d)CMP kinase [Tropicimonas isoalkanivorans]|uniref:Cytidylate kinase n=1 Tax=Tropicimonas isoalkanivorans TaxID=441112 RepID=A0A1I1JP00_9RHOB|nr:(d)CMP kinase [Tropicimonas isoalkanivorans]SFC50206.1 cytidylate kinase [Tropicimonas isoalkanivorans]
MSLTIAIDGPAASGKGTVARALAQRLGYAHLDTGLLYRAVGRKTLEGMAPLEAAQSLSASDVADADALRAPDVARAASRVAAMPEVRAALIGFQRAFAQRMGGAVLDGRDIGTVICPDADVKLFVTATDAVRAARRHKELLGKGHDVTLDEVTADLAERDRRDAARATAPLVPAKDAVLIDTSAMSIETAVRTALDAIRAVQPELG